MALRELIQELKMPIHILQHAVINRFKGLYIIALVKTISPDVKLVTKLFPSTHSTAHGLSSQVCDWIHCFQRNSEVH